LVDTEWLCASVAEELRRTEPEASMEVTVVVCTIEEFAAEETEASLVAPDVGVVEVLTYTATED
jgi:hypothetical protein